MVVVVVTTPGEEGENTGDKESVREIEGDLDCNHSAYKRIIDRSYLF